MATDSVSTRPPSTTAATLVAGLALRSALLRCSSAGGLTGTGAKATPGSRSIPRARTDGFGPNSYSVISAFGKACCPRFCNMANIDRMPRR